MPRTSMLYLLVLAAAAGCGGHRSSPQSAVLPAPTRSDSSPAWSPDGTHIAFASWRAASGYGLWVMRADGSDQRYVTGGPDIDSPAWSPDGTHIAFGRPVYDGNGEEIYLVRVDGTDLRRLTSDEHRDDSPVWSPDGGRLAFTKLEDQWEWRRAVYIVGRDGTRVARLGGAGQDASSPSWSPDGGRIVYARDGQIWVANADGTGAAMLAADPERSDDAPAWSPDGSRIAWDRGTWSYPGSSELWVMAADGTDQHPLGLPQGSSANPAWSPDSRQLLFTQGNQGHPPAAICLIAADGTGFRELVPVDLLVGPQYLALTAGGPAWSPDGSRVAFCSEVTGEPRIWVINTDGSGLANLSDQSSAPAFQ